MRNRKWILYAVTFVLGIALGLALVAASGTGLVASPVTQPVRFPHDKHVGLNIDCAACHTGAREGTHAGIPSTRLCALCHRADRTSPPTPPELAAYLTSGQEIPWVQFQRTPRHVYFSHHRHVTLGKVDCATCHGDMKSLSAPIAERRFPGRMEGMLRCVDCHRKEKVTSDCEACHR